MSVTRNTICFCCCQAHSYREAVLPCRCPTLPYPILPLSLSHPTCCLPLPSYLLPLSLCHPSLSFEHSHRKKPSCTLPSLSLSLPSPSRPIHCRPVRSNPVLPQPVAILSSAPDLKKRKPASATRSGTASADLGLNKDRPHDCLFTWLLVYMRRLC